MTLKKVYKKVRTAIIYEIICLTNGERYIGSTIQPFCNRLFTHKNNLNCSSKIIINRNNYKVNKLETFKTRFELAVLLKEQYYINNTININDRRALTLKKQKKIKQKNYRKNNSNKDYPSKQFIKCDCGGNYQTNNHSKNRHFQTKKHKKYLNRI